MQKQLSDRQEQRRSSSAPLEDSQALLSVPKEHTDFRLCPCHQPKNDKQNHLPRTEAGPGSHSPVTPPGGPGPAGPYGHSEIIPGSCGVPAYGTVRG
eukprot:741934-Hanusia_phi.AAC.4